MSSADSFSYRSPITKLLRFFRHSRDQWKAKCKTAKRENKSLKTRLAKMKESRDRWKAEARCLRNDLRAETVPAEKKTKKPACSTHLAAAANVRDLVGSVLCTNVQSRGYCPLGQRGRRERLTVISPPPEHWCRTRRSTGTADPVGIAWLR